MALASIDFFALNNNKHDDFGTSWILQSSSVSAYLYYSEPILNRLINISSLKWPSDIFFSND